MKFKYKAFISYKHSELGRAHAIALETALKRYAKPILKPPIKIFRDEKHMVPSNDLPKLIQDGLRNSEFLIFLASKESSESTWCNEEILFWCNELKRFEKLIIIHINDDIVMDPRNKSIDWERSNALPKSTSAYFKSIPFYLDFSWAKKPTQRDLFLPRYKSLINTLSSKFRNISPEELNDKEIRTHRRNVFLRNIAITLILFSLTIAVIFLFFALSERNKAIQEAKISKAQAVASKAQQIGSGDPTAALHMAAYAYNLFPSDETAGVLADFSSQVSYQNYFFRKSGILRGHHSVVSSKVVFLLNTQKIEVYNYQKQLLNYWPIPLGFLSFIKFIEGQEIILFANRDSLQGTDYHGNILFQLTGIDGSSLNDVNLTKDQQHIFMHKDDFIQVFHINGTHIIDLPFLSYNRSRRASVNEKFILNHLKVQLFERMEASIHDTTFSNFRFENFSDVLKFTYPLSGKANDLMLAYEEEEFADLLQILFSFNSLPVNDSEGFESEFVPIISHNFERQGLITYEDESDEAQLWLKIYDKDRQVIQSIGPLHDEEVLFEEIKFTPDDQHIIIPERNGMIDIWQVGGELAKKFIYTWENLSLSDLKISSNGRYLTANFEKRSTSDDLSGPDYNEFVIWDLGDGQQNDLFNYNCSNCTVYSNQDNFHFSFSNYGTDIDNPGWFICLESEDLVQFNAKEEKVRIDSLKEGSANLLYHVDEGYVLSMNTTNASSIQFKVFEVVNAQTFQSIEDPFEGMDVRDAMVNFDFSSKLKIITYSIGQTVRTIGFDGNKIGSFKVGSRIKNIEISPDGRSVLILSSESNEDSMFVKTFHLNGELVHSFKAPLIGIPQITWSPKNSSVILSDTWDSDLYSLNGEILHDFENDRHNGFEYSSDGKYLMSFGDELKIYDSDYRIIYQRNESYSLARFFPGRNDKIISFKVSENKADIIHHGIINFDNKDLLNWIPEEVISRYKLD